VKELASLVDRNIAYPGTTIDTAAFPAPPPDWLSPFPEFWSSSPYAGDASYALGIVFLDFSYGAVLRLYQSERCAVRLVRAGQ
jgi:Protein of unknown function (DUF1566)